MLPHILLYNPCSKPITAKPPKKNSVLFQHTPKSQYTLCSQTFIRCIILIKKGGKLAEEKSIVTVAIGKCIRFQRDFKKMSREKLAEQSTLSSNYIGQNERGESSPSYDEILLKFAFGLGLDPLVLFRQINNEILPIVEEEVKKNRSENLYSPFYLRAFRKRKIVPT
ncbi:hypothetical protein BKP37_08925 [Anaerobacillus alkalilacustris]|uniref:HTH cro/C1-type domain-containing protein n=1 Tax=Anaerobacillus alkalilacustris TaxID=393763 RepID=A0A1S2LP53_9BACI|nr:helix-turn-helix domain-containing protein [Anaerobacillus alkalilacustris]OIJ14288.1 hypothetical protein BKP37_08925 [Anaerobacillus alkalilacustris]